MIKIILRCFNRWFETIECVLIYVSNLCIMWYYVNNVNVKCIFLMIYPLERVICSKFSNWILFLLFISHYNRMFYFYKNVLQFYYVPRYFFNRIWWKRFKKSKIAFKLIVYKIRSTINQYITKVVTIDWNDTKKQTVFNLI